MNLKSKLAVEAGFATTAGNNESNEDSLGVRVPDEPDLSTKGIAAVIADGVSVAEAGKQAAQICVNGFLNDYFDAPEVWTVKSAGERVIKSLNRWLYGLGQGYTSTGQGYVTTFSALVIKGATGYLFHVGDSRIYRLRNNCLEQLTHDHSVRLGRQGVGLARAMGMDSKVDAEFSTVVIEVGDLFLLTTDGVHGFLEAKQMLPVLREHSSDIDETCTRLTELALEKGSNDNCSASIVKVLAAGSASNDEMYRHFRQLPFPPELYPGMSLDGYDVTDELQATSRSQTYIVTERSSGKRMVMKTPSVNYEDDTAYIERFIMEGWIGFKLKHERLVASIKSKKRQNFLYTLLEYLEGPTLEKWVAENPKPDVRQVVSIAKEVLQGLRAMHRQEMLHQDLKPGNVILVEGRGAVIIDYGSTHVPGIQEIPSPFQREQALGTVDYSAPEYFLGRKPTRKSDLFSLGVIVYEMLTGKFPYGSKYDKCQSVRDFANLEYVPATRHNSMVPTWLDGAIRKAISINPQSRYDSYSEFEYDLEHPNPKFLPSDALPFIERNPTTFWKIVSGAFFVTQAVTLWWFLR